MNAVAKKLQIKPGSNWLVMNAPEDYLVFLEPLPDGAQTTFAINGAVDGVQLFVKNKAELEAELLRLQPLLKPETIIWITYPKKSSNIVTDLEMMSSWDELAKYNLRPVASAAINDTWTALRFKPANQVKTSDSRNAAIKTNDYSHYIDVDNKTVSLPNDVKDALRNFPQELGYFNGLAYSHKKEYVVWVLSAKQEKTRLARVEKMVEMLQNKKKNPTEK